MKTRSRVPVKSKLKEKEALDEAKQSNSKALQPSVEHPPKVFILPEGRSEDSCFVSLANPATGTHAQYFFDPKVGFYEITRIAASKAPLRSWLLAPESSSQDGDDQTTTVTTGYITKTADLHVATPIDALFLMLPALFPKSASKVEGKQLFLSFDDYLDMLGASSPQLCQLLKFEPTRAIFLGRVGAACEVVDAGDESMWRLSVAKLAEVLKTKAEQMTKLGLPASMEAKYVTEPLQEPASIVLSEEHTATGTTVTNTDGETQSPATNSQPVSLATDESQQSTESIETVSTAATSFSAISGDDSLETRPNKRYESSQASLRLRVALNFLLASYVPPQLRPLILGEIKIDYSVLDTNLERLASLRSQAQALRAISDNVSRKRMLEEDEEKVEARAEKKRRLEEEEKKKKMQSHGVKQLAKVNTKGMQKLSSFFTKTPANK